MAGTGFGGDRSTSLALRSASTAEGALLSRSRIYSRFRIPYRNSIANFCAGSYEEWVRFNFAPDPHFGVVDPLPRIYARRSEASTHSSQERRR